MPNLDSNISLTETERAQWMRLARHWNCTIEDAIERAGKEMLDRLPEPTFSKENNVIFVGSEK